MESLLDNLSSTEDFLAKQYKEIVADLDSDKSSQNSKLQTVYTNESDQENVNMTDKANIYNCQETLIRTSLSESSHLIVLLSKTKEYPSIIHSKISFLGTTETILNGIAEIYQTETTGSNEHSNLEENLKSLETNKKEASSNAGKTCGVCGLKFASSITPEAHNKRFSRFKFSCQVCGFRYTMASLLWKHVEKQHQINASLLFENTYRKLPWARKRHNHWRRKAQCIKENP